MVQSIFDSNRAKDLQDDPMKGGKKHFNAECKRSTKQACQSILLDSTLDQEEHKWLEYAKIKQNRPVTCGLWSNENM